MLGARASNEQLLGSRCHGAGPAAPTYQEWDNHDRVSASSGIASANSWLEEPELSGSSCEFSSSDPRSASSRRGSRNASRRRLRDHKNRDTSSPSPRGQTGAASQRCASTTPSTTIEHASCLTETTDCPSSDVSVITSISRKTLLDNLRLKSAAAAAEDVPDVIQRVQPSSQAPPMMQQQHQHTIVRAQLHQIPKHLQHMTRPLQVMSPLQLRMLVREKLMSEGIRLSAPPYTSPKVGLN